MRTMCEIVVSCGPLDTLRLVAGEWVGRLGRCWPLQGATAEAARTSVSPRLATSALLLDVASADGALSLEERRYIESILRREFGLGGVQAERLLRSADSARRSAPDPRLFTNEILERLSGRQRALFSAIIQELAQVEGGPTPEQEYTVRKITSLLRLEADCRPEADRV